MINFLSTCGKIEVSTPSHSHKWRRKFMPVKYSYRQISLKDSFSDCQDIFVDDAPLSSSSLMNILIFRNSSLPFSAMLFTSTLAENGITLLKLSSPPSSFRKSFPSLLIPFCFFSSDYAGNSGSSAAFPRCLMLLF